MIDEVFVCVDVETAGPVPSQYAMLSIGACLVENDSVNFYTELKPDRKDFTPEALAISGLSLDELELHGTEPGEAMRSFAEWVESVVPADSRAVFVALNAPFDWMFINDYFFRYLGRNPFGHSALDVKAFYMGMTGVSWAETSLNRINEKLKDEIRLTHNALRDAQDQAELFHKLLDMSRRME